jgi:hypothetical protein
MNAIDVKKITIYRSYDLLFMGYYENALVGWCKANRISYKIRSPRYAKITYSPREVGIRGQMYFTIETENTERKCFVDISDGFYDIRLSLLKEVDIYFKCNYSADYVESLDLEASLKNKIVPSSLFFPINLFRSKRQLGSYFLKSAFELLGFDKNSSIKNDILRWEIHVSRAYQLAKRPSLSFYYTNRGISEFENDVFFSSATWYNEDKELTEDRAKTIRALRSIKEFKIHAEFIYNKEAKNEFPDLMIDYKRDLMDYYNLMNKSKIVVVNKSLSGGAISWRVGECLSLGKVFICQNSPNDFYQTKLLDSELGVYNDTDDLINKIKYILTHEDVFIKLQKESIYKYEYYFSPLKTAEYLIDKSLMI